MLIRNVLDNVQKSLTDFVRNPSVFTVPSLDPTFDREESSNKKHLPVILLDIMFSTFFHADITDLEEQIGLLAQTISSFTPAIRLMNGMNGDVAVSCDLSIRRLNYLCQKLLEFSTDEQRNVICESVAQDLVNISLNMHGTRAVQKMIDFLSTQRQVSCISRSVPSPPSSK